MISFVSIVEGGGRVAAAYAAAMVRSIRIETGGQTHGGSKFIRCNIEYDNICKPSERTIPIFESGIILYIFARVGRSVKKIGRVYDRCGLFIGMYPRVSATTVVREPYI